MKDGDDDTIRATYLVSEQGEGLMPSFVATLADAVRVKVPLGPVLALDYRLGAGADPSPRGGRLSKRIPFLTDVQHLLIVPDGALESLPFSVLATEAPDRTVEEVREYRDLPFLAKRYAVTTLPTVGSLRALRQFAKGSPAPEPFTGFGDPLLEGGKGGGSGIDVAKLFTARGVVDVGEVRRLPRLPETADELRAIGAGLKAPPAVIHLQAEATEERVKSTDLSPYRVLMFATHGLMAGEVE